jgi:hypothetical protein
MANLSEQASSSNQASQIEGGESGDTKPTPEAVTSRDTGTFNPPADTNENIKVSSQDQNVIGVDFPRRELPQARPEDKRIIRGSLRAEIGTSSPDL